MEAPATEASPRTTTSEGQTTTTQPPATTTERPAQTTDASAETTESPTASPQPVAEPAGLGNVSLLGLIVGILAILVAGLWFYRSQR